MVHQCLLAVVLLFITHFVWCILSIIISYLLWFYYCCFYDLQAGTVGWVSEPR